MLKEALREQVKETWLGICKTAKKIGGAVISEADTRRHLIDPLLEVLGWRSLEDFGLERAIPGGGIADYVLMVNRVDKVLVEAKGLRAVLTDKDRAQLLDYCNRKVVRWGILTNGSQIELYDQHRHGGLERKFVYAIDLLRDEEKFDQLFSALWPISKEAVAEGYLERYAKDLEIQRQTRSLLGVESSPVVASLARELSKNMDEKVSKQEAVKVLRDMLHLEIQGKIKPEPEWPAELLLEVELREYLQGLHKWRLLTYDYYKVLASHPGKVTRAELLDSLQKLQGKAFGGRIFAGIFSGITRTWEKEAVKGKEKLDWVSQDKKEFSINEKYRDMIQKVISSLEASLSQ